MPRRVRWLCALLAGHGPLRAFAPEPGGPPAVLPACEGLAQLESVAQVRDCVGEVSAIATPDQGKALQKGLRTLQETRDACTAALDKATSWGCKALSDLAYEVFAEAAGLLHVCRAGPPQACDERGRAAASNELSAWIIAEERFRNTPAETLVSRRLEELRHELFAVLLQEERIGEGEEAMPPAWQAGLRAVDRLKHWVSGYIWRETHWLWLQDSLMAGRVVQTTWGTADEWLRFGVHDAHADMPLGQPAPHYTFDKRLGMRWEILSLLLQELFQRRGAQEQLVVVELGVFAGHLAHFVLRDCGFVRYLGVDPYIGRDGTFPGNFSRTLDADVALYKAASVVEPHAGRAEIWPMTSEAAAADVEDGSVDVVFVDGCHLYECVKADFQLWMPKMRRGVETLIAGHDFSPQWPGVVRAVHEQRAGGRQVNLATDWMFWWFDQYE